MSSGVSTLPVFGYAPDLSRLNSYQNVPSKITSLARFETVLVQAGLYQGFWKQAITFPADDLIRIIQTLRETMLEVIPPRQEKLKKLVRLR